MQITSEKFHLRTMCDLCIEVSHCVPYIIRSSEFHMYNKLHKRLRSRQCSERRQNCFVPVVDSRHLVSGEHVTDDVTAAR